MKRSDDRIYWAPLDARRPTRVKRGAYLAHYCPTAVVGAATERESLDPMALGTCRYCGERLS